MTPSKNISFTIGAFILGVIVLLFVALLFFSGGRVFAKKDRIIMYFDGSVQGLQVGAPVKLKGVVLGEISDIQINFQNDDKTVLTAVTADLVMKRINSKGSTVDSEFFTNAINNGLRAQLNFQSFLTGLLYVELDFYPDTPIKFYQLDNKYRELPTTATQFEVLSKSLANLDIEAMVTHIDELAIEITKIVKNGNIPATISNINRAANAIEHTANTLNTHTAQLSNNIEQTRQELDTLLKQLNQHTPVLAQSLNQSLKALQDSLVAVNQSAKALNNTFSEDAPTINQLNATLKEISRSAQALRGLSDTLEQQPEALIRGRTATPNHR
jgi:paraquat-inducible protein B